MAAKKVLRKGMIPSTNSAEFRDMGRFSAFNLRTSGKEQVSISGSSASILGALEGAANIQSQRYRPAPWPELTQSWQVKLGSVILDILGTAEKR